MEFKETNFYGILCESDQGLDPFDNPIGKPILLEQTECFDYGFIQDKLEKIKNNNSFGKCSIVRLYIECEDVKTRYYDETRGLV